MIYEIGTAIRWGSKVETSLRGWQDLLDEETSENLDKGEEETSKVEGEINWCFRRIRVAD